MALSKEEAKRLSIISVAEQLGIELKRTGSYSYTWTEHDSFVIDARKNEFHWNSKTEFGDVIQLVLTKKRCIFWKLENLNKLIQKFRWLQKSHFTIIWKDTRIRTSAPLEPF